MIPLDFYNHIISLLGSDLVLSSPAELSVYESDGLTGYHQIPGLVVFPLETSQVSQVVKACSDFGIPFVARGAGTGLSGGALPSPDGVLIVLSKMRKILEIDPINQRMVVEPGVTNIEISKAVSKYNLYYAPDPSSQIVCTIGGNVAENSGGAHCLKYGFTTHHVLGLEVVFPDGSIEQIGSSTLDFPGYDLRGAIIGSEGTLGIVTKIVVKLTRIPESVATLVADFESPEQAGEAVTGIIGAGIIPAAVEMLDSLAIQACEAATHSGFSLDAGAVLIVEVDGPDAETKFTFEQVKNICKQALATNIKVAETSAQRAAIWAGRKSAFAAVGRISPSYYVQDGVIPRTALGSVLAKIAKMSLESGIRVANVFHAGDGNLHPLVLYNPSIEFEAQKAEKLASDIVALCVEAGGSITGEHGVGVDKACSMPKMFSEQDIEIMLSFKSAFDPQGICNPDKIFPTPRLCGESPGPYKAHPLEKAGIAERF